MNSNQLYMPDPFVARREAQFSVKWVQQNGELFAEQWDRFYKNHPHTEWEMTARTTLGTITLIATKKEKTA